MGVIGVPKGFWPEHFWPDNFWPETEEYSKRCLDTVAILSEWSESLTVKRKNVDYSVEIPEIIWVDIGTFLGDWQPVYGTAMRKESGLKIKSKALVIAPCGVNVEGDDRIYRADGSFMIVNYVNKYEDHLTAFLKITETN